jgi:acyl carrier protein
MEIENFLIKFAGCFDDIEPGAILPETEFRNLEKWDSLTALTLLAMVDADFDVSISATELRLCNKVQDIFELIKQKKS